MSGAPSKIITAFIEPIRADKLLPMKHRLQAITASHEPGTAPPDFDHPLTKTLVEALPRMTYGQLEAARDRLMMSNGDDGGKRWISNARDRDGWLRMVNAEMQQRDRIREAEGDELIDFLTKGTRQ